jgi:hypothetical protein
MEDDDRRVVSNFSILKRIDRTLTLIHEELATLRGTASMMEVELSLMQRQLEENGRALKELKRQAGDMG